MTFQRLTWDFSFVSVVCDYFILFIFELCSCERGLLNESLAVVAEAVAVQIKTREGPVGLYSSVVCHSLVRIIVRHFSKWLTANIMAHRNDLVVFLLSQQFLFFAQNIADHYMRHEYSKCHDPVIVILCAMTSVERLLFSSELILLQERFYLIESTCTCCVDDRGRSNQRDPRPLLFNVART